MSIETRLPVWMTNIVLAVGLMAVAVPIDWIPGASANPGNPVYADLVVSGLAMLGVIGLLLCTLGHVKRYSWLYLAITVLCACSVILAGFWAAPGFVMTTMILYKLSCMILAFVSWRLA